MWTQILLPLLVAVLVFAGVIILTSLATFRGNGDVARWAAISTIWLVLPVLVIGLLLLALLIVMIVLVSRLKLVVPPYTYQGQRIMYRFEGSVRRGAAMIRKPVLGIKELIRMLRIYLERTQEG